MLKINRSGLENNLNFYFNDKVAIFSQNYSLNDETDVFEICLTVILGIVMILSVIGNVSTCAVIIRERSMKTPTNYYLLNLAIVDLLTATFIPLEITILWIPDLMGKVTGHTVIFFWDLLCNCSSLTILALTIERYIVISKPFLRQTFVLNSRVLKILTVTWMIAASFCMLNVSYLYNIEDHTNVYIYFNAPPARHVLLLMAVEVLIFFFIPMIVITMLYGLIVLKLKTTHSLRYSPAFVKQNRSKATKMLAAIAASFFICWSPYCVLRIMAIFPELRKKKYFNLWQTFCYLNCINSYASTAVNPILYNLMSRKFRRAFKALMKGRDASNRKMSEDYSIHMKTSKHTDSRIKITSIELNTLQHRSVYRGNNTFY